MIKRYAFILPAVLGLWSASQPVQAQCTGAVAGTSLVNNGLWNAPTVPPTMTGYLTTTTLALTNTATVSSSAGLTIGTIVSGPNFPPGTTITGIAGTTITLSNNAIGLGTNVLHGYTVPGWANNYPPNNILAPGNTGATTAACSVCPSAYSVNICANNYAQVYMCAGNIYTITVCNSTTFAINTSLTITNTAMNTSYAYDAGSCGGGLSQITFVPTISQAYRIRLFQSPCVANSTQCGLFQISCNPPPPAPTNDEVAGAISLGSPAPVVCSMITGTTAWATQSASIPSTCSPGPCGSLSGLFSGFDVWFSVGVPATGNLSVILSEISAGPTTFAVYSNAMVEIACSCANFVSLSGLVGGSTAYIRVWPRSGSVNSGSFELCAYEPIPPPNDNPCGAVALPVGLSCNLTVFSTESATSLQAGMTTTPASPSCGTPVAGGDVWFSAVMPASGVMTITSQAGTLTDMAMAVYTLTAGNICAPGTLTEAYCNDTYGASTMPAVQVGGAPGTTYYIRMWNKTAAFGTASICAVQNMPPPNDDPCGAIALPVNLGCTFGAPFSTQFATPTGNTAPGAVSIPNPAGCPGTGSPYTSDVWFTAVVPASGQLVLDTDDGQLTNAAMAVYTAGGTTCPNLSLTLIGCAMGGSANGASMPTLTIALLPGTPVYIRIWRDGGNDGTFLLCARNPVVPAGCYYTLRLADSAGDGWNGGFVTLCIGGVCTNYTVYGSLSTIVFTASVGQVVTLSYTPVGGFQNQISYNLQASNGFNIFVSSNPPTSGFNAGFTVNAACNVPAAPISDCLGAFPVCSNQNISLAPGNFGNSQDLNAANHGCLLSNERQGAWYRFTSNAAGTIAFTINVAVGTDYDFGVWGPPTWNGSCPPNAPPIRCNWSAVTGNTGLNYTSLNNTEGAGGPPFSRWIDVLPNQDFLLYIDNYTMNGLTFLLAWNNSPNTILDCLLPVEFLELQAVPGPRQVDLKWSTASEHNSAYFQVERAADGNRYEPLGIVPAAGNSTTLTEYSFVDKEPLSGVNYYRLDQVDADGQRNYSNVVTAMFRWGSVAMNVYPNPAGQSLFASVELPDEGGVRYRIHDASGRLVRSGLVQGTSGMNQLEIPLDIDAGSYLLDLSDHNGVPLGNARFVRR